jgi:hypothetical protein
MPAVRMLRIWRTGNWNTMYNNFTYMYPKPNTLNFYPIPINKIIGMDVLKIIRWHLPNICWIVLMLI